MKKFKFKFERLLDIRKFLEREEQFKFAEVLSRYVKTQNTIEDAKKLNFNYLMNSKNQINSLDINYLQNRDKARLGLVSKINIHKNILKQQKYEVEREREILIDVSKKKKTIEILKEKEFKRYKEEVEKIENEEINEIGSNMYFKNKFRNAVKE